MDGIGCLIFPSSIQCYSQKCESGRENEVGGGPNLLSFVSREYVSVFSPLGHGHDMVISQIRVPEDAIPLRGDAILGTFQRQK